MRTAFLLVIAMASVGCADCSDDGEKDSDPWMVGEGEPDSGAPATDDGQPGPDGGTPLPDDLPSCVDADTYVFQSNGSEFVVSPVVTNDRVFVSGGTDDDPTQQLREWTEDGIIQHTDSDALLGMIAASEQYIWLSSPDGPVLRFELATNDIERLDLRGIEYQRIAWNFHYAQMRRTANGNTFGWLQDSSIFLVEDRDTRELGTGATLSPWVTDRVVTYEFAEGLGRSIRVHQGEDFFEFGQQESSSSWPVATDQAVFFVHDGEVRRVGLSGSNNQPVLEDRFCGPMHADRHTAVTACAPTGPPNGATSADYLSLGATEVWTFDGATGQADRVATSDGPIYAPVVSKNWIVWTEYDGDLGGQPPVAGRVMVLPRGTGGEPTSIAWMGAGCPFCGAYWPPPRLVLGENTLAWNYPLEGERGDEMFGPRSTYGVAHLRPCD